MAYSKPALSLVVVALILLSLVEGLTPWCDWVLTKKTDGAITSFPNIQNSGSPSLSSDDGSDFASSISCGSLYMNQASWNLQADFSTLISGQLQLTFGFWVNFESTIGNEFFFIGTSPQGVRVSSSTEGELVVKIYSGAGTTSSANDLAVTVPKNKWLFLVIYFYNSGNGAIIEKVLVTGHTAYSITTPNGYSLPSGNLKFGKDIKAKFYEVLIISSVSLDDDLLTINLYDIIGGRGAYAKPCTEDCADAQCTSDGKCIAKYQLCTSCSAGSCTGCSDSSLNPSSFCNSCNSGFTLTSGKCNFYLGCNDANNCATCATSSTICDSCPANYFLYKASVSSTSCISCTDSCTNCSPGPNCYECADSIIQSGNICLVNKIGYQFSFDYPNIVVDFAYPLSSALTKNLFTATTIGGSPIPTTAWTFTGCASGSTQCIIGTDLTESDLPIDLEIKFEQA